MVKDLLLVLILVAGFIGTWALARMLKRDARKPVPVPRNNTRADRNAVQRLRLDERTGIYHPAD